MIFKPYKTGIVINYYLDIKLPTVNIIHLNMLFIKDTISRYNTIHRNNSYKIGVYLANESYF